MKRVTGANLTVIKADLLKAKPAAGAVQRADVAGAPPFLHFFLPQNQLASKIDMICRAIREALPLEYFGEISEMIIKHFGLEEDKPSLISFRDLAPVFGESFETIRKKTNEGLEALAHRPQFFVLNGILQENAAKLLKNRLVIAFDELADELCGRRLLSAKDRICLRPLFFLCDAIFDNRGGVCLVNPASPKGKRVQVMPKAILVKDVEAYRRFFAFIDNAKKHRPYQTVWRWEIFQAMVWDELALSVTRADLMALAVPLAMVLKDDLVFVSTHALKLQLSVLFIKENGHQHFLEVARFLRCSPKTAEKLLSQGMREGPLKLIGHGVFDLADAGPKSVKNPADKSPQRVSGMINAIREVLLGSDGPLTSMQIRKSLEEAGFRYSDRSIVTALTGVGYKPQREEAQIFKQQIEVPGQEKPMITIIVYGLIDKHLQNS